MANEPTNDAAAGDAAVEEAGHTSGVVLTETAWALRNRLNPFPVGGILAWDGATLTFTLGALAGEARLGWVEDRLGIEGLPDRLKGGEEVTVVSVPEAALEVSWPAMFAGSALEITDQGGRKWLVSLDYPSGGSISKSVSLFTGRKKGKAWKKALAG